MRPLWQQIHTDFERIINLHTSKKQFEALRHGHPVLGRFTDTTAVLDYLHSRNGDPDDKNLILAILVSAAQSSGDRDLAAAMVWLALWPGLDALYRRLWRYFRTDPCELVSEVAGRFAVEMQRADLRRINRVAATLIANVERDIRAGLRRRWTESALRQEMPEPDELGSDSRPSSAHFDLPPGIGPDDEVEIIRQTIAHHVGCDADIVIAVAVMGEGQREVASRLGITHDAVRKRFQRALGRLRQSLEEI